MTPRRHEGLSTPLTMFAQGAGKECDSMSTAARTNTPVPAPDSLDGLAIGRDFLEPRIDLDGKSVLVTGGTGSFGKAFARMVGERYTPRKLIVFSRDELKQY